jgi:hypothetical protein
MNMRQHLISAVLTSVVLLISPCAQATQIVLGNNVISPMSAVTTDCVGADGLPYKNCTSTGYVKNGDALMAITPELRSEFNAWNNLPITGDGPHGGDKAWTLEAGGALPGGTFRVDSFYPWAEIPAGGVHIGLNWDFEGDRTGYVWIQAIHSNYARSNINADYPGSYEIVDPFFLLDTCGATLKATDPQCNDVKAPAYPFQNPMGDHAGGPWLSSFLDAQSFIARIDETQHKITVFEGVAWGFHLVPEPSTLALLLCGLPALLLRRQRCAGTLTRQAALVGLRLYRIPTNIKA